MRRYPLYVLDLDGTVYRGETAIPGAVDAVTALVERGSRVRYLTNNSSKRREQFCAKLTGMGFPCEVEWVVTSASLTARYLSDCRSVAAIGEQGLVDELRATGLRVRWVVVDAENEEPEALVVGIDRTFDYARMAEGLRLLLKPGRRFVATNTDATYPVEGGGLIPGAGSIVCALSTAAGRSPEVVGKPQPFGINEILRETGVAPTDCLVVGDRYETDVVAGIAASCDVHLVLTGVTEVAPEGVSWSPDLSTLV